MPEPNEIYPIWFHERSRYTVARRRRIPWKVIAKVILWYAVAVTLGEGVAFGLVWLFARAL